MEKEPQITPASQESEEDFLETQIVDSAQHLADRSLAEVDRIKKR